MQKILIVEDEEGIRESLKVILSEEGYSVSTTGSGEHALDLLRQNGYDLVLSDILMPGISGLELLERIGENWPETKVIIITGHGYSETRVTAFNLGAEDFIPKPFTLEELLIRVKQALSRETVASEAHRPKAVQLHLTEENRRLREQMNRLKGDSTAIESIEKYRAICGAVAHDLRGEFMHIGSSVKGIREMADSNPDILEECDVIDRSIRYSNLVLQRLLNYIEIGEPRIELADPMIIMLNAMTLAIPRIPSNIKLETVALPSAFKRRVRVDTGQLIGVLMELINNAINALRQKGGVIQLGVEERGSEISMFVKNNGPQIPKQMRERLFKEQVSSKSGGLGLGLYLSSKVINALGGRLDLQSSKKETTFTISLPAVKDAKETSDAGKNTRSG